MDDDVQIREMTDKDWESVAKIYQQGIDSHIATFQTSVAPYEEFRSSHLDFGALVAVSENRVVGWIALSPTSRRSCYKGVVEISIYIADGYRGIGIGRLLLSRELEIAKAKGVWTLQSVVLDQNTASYHLHKNLGFRFVGYREKVARDCFGTWHNTYLFEYRFNIEED